MSVLSKRVALIEAELGADWRRYHVAAQLARFGSGFVATLLWSLHSGLSDWTDVVPLAGTAAWVTAMQMWPQVPWWLLRGRFGSGKVAAAPVSGGSVPAAGTGGAPPPAQG